MAESTFQKIKRHVEEEKNKKVRGEARLASLTDEQERIFSQVQEETGKTINSIEEVEGICENLKENIESEIAKMVEVLREEGIEV